MNTLSQKCYLDRDIVCQTDSVVVATSICSARVNVNRMRYVPTCVRTYVRLCTFGKNGRKGP